MGQYKKKTNSNQFLLKSPRRREENEAEKIFEEIQKASMFRFKKLSTSDRMGNKQKSTRRSI